MYVKVNSFIMYGVPLRPSSFYSVISTRKTRKYENVKSRRRKRETRNYDDENTKVRG